MHGRRNYSITSAPFRREWRPSRWMSSAWVLLGLLAAFSFLNCALETHIVWPMALLVLGVGLLQAWREAASPVRQLLVSPSAASIDGVVVETPQLLERGPLTILRWHAGKRRGQLLFWPDTLPRAQRRELRLAVRAHVISR